MKNENGAAQSSMDVTAQGGGGGGYQADYGLTPIQSQVSIQQTHRQTERHTDREREREKYSQSQSSVQLPKIVTITVQKTSITITVLTFGNQLHRSFKIN